MSDIFIKLAEIEKRFHANIALNNVSFNVRRGSVHAIVGENGAGKSTLMNIISGGLSPDRGIIELDGRQVKIDSPRTAKKLGIAMIHQELTMLENLTVAQNIVLGNAPRKALFLVDRKKQHDIAQAQLQRLGLDISPDTSLATLPVGKRQMIEIAKALSLHAHLLIMDEPTSALSQKEIAELFTIIDVLKKENITILYISHQLDEIFSICDMVTVLRDGNHIKTVAIAELSHAEMVRLMVGDDIQSVGRRESKYEDEILMRVKNFTLRPCFQDIDIAIRRGEILGLFGQLGAGRTELAQAMCGLRRAEKGYIAIDGKEIIIGSTTKLNGAKLGIAYVPEDRRQQGLFLHQSVRHNITIAILDACSKFLMRIPSIANRMAQQLVERLYIKTASLKVKMSSLSGGNQQKVILARWIASKPKVLIMDEPTRGIDVKAKAHIYTLIHNLAAEGMTILLISSELMEIYSVCDTIAIMRNGVIRKVSRREDIDMKEMVMYATGER